MAHGSAAAAPGAAPARKTMRVKVLSPARAVFDGEAVDVVLPAFDGEWGVLPNHAPMVAALAVGCLRITTPGGGGQAFAIRGGFAEVRDNTVTVLSPECRGPSELTPEALEAEFGKPGEGAGEHGQRGEHARQHTWARACRVAMGKLPRKPET